MTVMSDKLKETLGILEAKGVDIKEAPSYDDAFVDPETGEIIQNQESKSTALVPFEPKQVPTTIPESETNGDIRDDYITSRNITHTLIDMTGGALKGALEVAVESQHPKAFSVFNELANTMRLLSKDLLEMQEIYKNITAEKAAKRGAVAPGTPINATQNNINIGATNASLADILKAIENGDMAALSGLGIAPPGEVIDG